MKTSLMLNAVLALSLVSSTGLPVLAEMQPVRYPAAPRQAITIPQSTAIIITVPADVVIEDVGKMQEQPITLLLAQPLLDHRGAVVAPVNSPVSGRIKPVESGVQIVVESLVIAGKVIPVQASSAVIPAKQITLQRGIDRAQERGAIASRLAGGAGAVFSKNPAIGDKVETAAGLLGVLIGLASPKKVQAVGIPQGSLHILALQSPVTIPME